MTVYIYIYILQVLLELGVLVVWLALAEALEPQECQVHLELEASLVKLVRSAT